MHAAGERFEARRAVVSAIDAKRVFAGLVDPADSPPPSRSRASGTAIHVGTPQNVSELKVDAVLAKEQPELGVPPGFERALMLSPNTDADIEAAFARIRLGELPERPPLMIGFPSARQRPAGHREPGNAVIWLSTFVPWEPAREAVGEQLARSEPPSYTWRAAERRPQRTELEPVERLITGPQDWVRTHGNPYAVPAQPRRDVARPAARHAPLAVRCPATRRRSPASS